MSCNCGCGCVNVNCTGQCGCTNCGTCDTPCGAVLVGTNPCVTQPSCGTTPCATATPYYAANPSCQEDHCQQIFTQTYATAICVNLAWNVPACGTTATLYFSNLKVLPVGAYIWHPDYGFFEVVAFDHNTGQVVVLNHCNDNNAAVGTNVPACTCFVVTATPEPDNDPTTFPFVAVDFTAPAVGNCLDITVTSTNGLVVGGEVQIGTGTYRLDAILSPSLITICNEGDGLTPGTVVVAKNEAGDYQYPIIVVSTSACDAPVASSGVAVVCDGGGLHPLDGPVTGQFLTLINSTTNTAAYASPCDNLVATSGAMLVCSSGIPAPLDGTALGQVPMLADLGTNAVEFRTIGADVEVDSDVGAVTNGLNPPGTFSNGPTVEITITNPTNRSMVIFNMITHSFNGSILPNADPGICELSFVGQAGQSTGAIGGAPAPVLADVLTQDDSRFGTVLSQPKMSQSMTHFGFLTLTPGMEARLNARMRVTLASSDGDDYAGDITSQILAYGVAI